MGDGIFLIKDDKSLVEMEEESYQSEIALQDLVADYPDLLAGKDIDAAAPRRWLLVAREAAVPDQEGGSVRWAADHLFLDQDGILTIVEVKRRSDTRIRREVVGQMLDYAANSVAFWTVGTIQGALEDRCEDEGLSVEEELAKLVQGGTTAKDFWEHVKTNLHAGRIRMLFVADEIPGELSRVVEFLNEQMDPAQVLAVEIRQFVGSGLKTLVPRVIGQTSEAQGRKQASARETRQWDEPSFMEALGGSKGEEAVQVARHLLDWARRVSDYVWWGKGLVVGSFIPVVKHKGNKQYPLGVWTDGKAEIQFERLKTKPPFDRDELRKELLAKMNEIPGISLAPDAHSRRPSVPLAELAIGDRLAAFLKALDWAVARIRES